MDGWLSEEIAIGIMIICDKYTDVIFRRKKNTITIRRIYNADDFSFMMIFFSNCVLVSFFL